jgi:thiamine transporter ThiT
MKRREIYNLVTAAMLFALGLVLPFLTAQLASLGNMLLPMHLPILLCGFICGWRYGLFCGAALPIIRSLLFSMPVLYPSAVTYAFELAAYGFFTGFIFLLFRRKNLTAAYAALISAMLIGRAVKGIASAVCYGIINKGYSFMMFISGSFIEAVPGIILQLLIIPAVLVAVGKVKIK